MAVRAIGKAVKVFKRNRTVCPVFRADGAMTRQGSHVCGHVARGNRRSQAQFSCRCCGYTTHADFNATLNIGADTGGLDSDEHAIDQR
jgi:transposase